MGFYLLLLGWDPAPHREDGERRKLNRSLLLHVWGSKMGEESKGGSKCEEKHQPARDSVRESGLGGVERGQFNHFSDKSDIIFPTSA